MKDNAEERENLTKNQNAPLLAQRPRLGRMFLWVGVLCIVLGVVAMLLPLPLYEASEENATAYFESLPYFLQVILVTVLPDEAPEMLIILPGALICGAGAFLIRHGRRHLVSVLTTGSIHAKPHEILYLRPFAADNTGIWRRPNFLVGMVSKRMRTWSVLEFRGIIR
jgi:hypothetical protein